MALKLLATGDLHIGKKSSSVPADADESTTKFTWNRVINWAIENSVDALLLTGDIVDQNNRYFEAIGPMQSGFEKLKQANIALYMVAGNHDYNVLPQLIDSEKYPNVHLLGKNDEWEIKKFSKNGDEIQFVGWSFPNQYVREDPTSKFNITEIDSNITTIGLIHGDVDNPESRYGPINSNNFLNKSVDTWVLGHIHKPRIFRDSAPHVCYPGSPHALSSKEQGAHGPILMTIESKDDIQIKSIPLSPVRYENIAIDITNKNDESSLRNAVTSEILNDAMQKIEELQDVSYLIYDVFLEGQHNNIKEIENWINPIRDDYNGEINETQTKLSVRKVLINVKPKVENIEELAKQSSPAGVLASTIIALQNDETTDFLNSILKEWNLKYKSINQSGTFQPLRATEEMINEPDKQSKQYILNECNRLLAELIGQQTQ